MSLAAAANKYARAVAAGREVAGPYVRAACKRHLADLKRKDIIFNKDLADRVGRFFESVCSLSQGDFEGEPFVPHPSQAFILASIYGWQKGGRRRFRRAYLEMGKGNGKTPLMAGIALYSLIADGEERGEIYMAASQADQAKICFKDACAMVARNHKLAAAVTVLGGNNPYEIRHDKSGSSIRPLAKTAGKSGSGLRPSVVLLDEMHEVTDRQMLELLERGLAKVRRQPLLVICTNSGTDRHSLCYEEHRSAVNVAEGIETNDQLFAYVCALDEDDEPLQLVDRDAPEPELLDIDLYRKANPLLGIVVDPAKLAQDAQAALQVPGRQNNFYRLHCCRWTDAHDAWISIEVLRAMVDEDLQIEDMAGRRWWGGLDLSGRRDITALAVLFDDGHTEDGRQKYALFVFSWIPEEGLYDRSQADRVPYDQWAAEGHLLLCDGARVEYNDVLDKIVEMDDLAECETIAYDAWQFGRFVEKMDERDFEAVRMIDHSQTHVVRKDSPLTMSDSIEVAEQLILEGRIRIAVNPVFIFAVSGAVFQTVVSGRRKFAKRDALCRIDPAVAFTMACGCADMDDAGVVGYYRSGGGAETMGL